MPRPGIALMVLGAGAIACAAADGRTETEPVADVIVRPAVVRLRAGEGAQLSAQVNDSTGRAIGGADLTFATPSPRMVRVSPSGAVSSLGPVGEGTITVASGSTHRMVRVVVAAGVATAARISSGGAQAGEVGSTLAEPVVVTISDAFGNLVPRAAVSFEAAGGGAADPASATTDATGVARTVWTLGETAGPQTLRATAADASVIVEAVAASGRMTSIEQVGAVVRRTSAGDTVPIRLRVADRHGNGVAGVVVAFAVERGGGMVAPARVETGVDGLAQTLWTTGTTAGLNALRVRAIDVRDTTVLVDLRTHGGAAASVQLVRGGGQRAVAGNPVAVVPTVRVIDAHGNVVSAARVRFAASAGGVVEPPEAVTDESGQTRVSRWVLGSAGENVLSVIVDGVADTLQVTALARPR